MKLPKNVTISVKGKTWKGGEECPDELVPESLKTADKKKAKSK